MSTRMVADRLPQRVTVSHATVANVESAKSQPSMELLAALAALYERPLNWFIESGPSLSGVRYRNLKSKVGVTDRHVFEGIAVKWLDAYQRVERWLSTPLPRRRSKLTFGSGMSGADAAKEVRKEFKLSDGDAVPSVVNLLEGMTTVPAPFTSADDTSTRKEPSVSPAVNPPFCSTEPPFADQSAFTAAMERPCWSRPSRRNCMRAPGARWIVSGNKSTLVSFCGSTCLTASSAVTMNTSSLISTSAAVIAFLNTNGSYTPCPFFPTYANSPSVTPRAIVSLTASGRRRRGNILSEESLRPLRHAEQASLVTFDLDHACKLVEVSTKALSNLAGGVKFQDVSAPLRLAA